MLTRRGENVAGQNGLDQAKTPGRQALPLYGCSFEDFRVHNRATTAG